MALPGDGALVNPRLRNLDAFPVEQDGQRMLALRDPAGVADGVILLPRGLVDLVSLFDGQRTVEEIQAVLVHRHGTAPTAEQIGRVVAQLDAAGILDSPGFRERLAAVEDGYRRAVTRPAAHAGGAYAGEPEALRRQIAAFSAGLPAGPGPGSGAPLRGLIAPHIDFHRGGPTYARAYRALREASDADLFVVLGTCHAGMADPFAVTTKAFETPLGQVAADRELCEALGRRYGGDLLASEPAHRQEHSVEFQAVMLQHTLGAVRPFTIVPVLASFLHEALWTRDDPAADPRVARFVDALGETLDRSGRRWCLLAGVDLAHVGPRFGDPEPNTPESLAAVGRADQEMLAAVTAADAAGFYASVASDGDARRICGLSPIYAFLRALPGARGQLLEYAQWPDPDNAVTFCAAAFS